MFKKTVLCGLAIALILMGLYVDPSAAQQSSVAQISKKGSLLVFPMIRTVGDFDTIISIGNDGASSVWIKCYWMDSDQETWDFEVNLTANQPFWFSAKTGNGSKNVSEFGADKEGELKCWAIDINNASASTEVLTRFNQLYGSAMVLYNGTASYEAYEYEAWAFALNRSLTASQGAGPLYLGISPDSGLQDYDYCPAYLVYNFFAEDANLTDGRPAFESSFLALSPCMQDLRQDRTPICTKAKFDVWNENENKLTGAYQCIKCYFEGELSDIGHEKWQDCIDSGISSSKCKYTGVGGTKFTKATLKTNMGRFRVTPDSFTACANVFAVLGDDERTVTDLCAGNIYKTPFIGVLVTILRTTSTGDVNAAAVTTGFGAGAFTAPVQGSSGVGPNILWDAAEKQQGAAQR